MFICFRPYLIHLFYVNCFRSLYTDSELRLYTLNIYCRQLHFVNYDLLTIKSLVYYYVLPVAEWFF